MADIKLEKGDILLYMDKNYNTFVAWGQGAEKVNLYLAWTTRKGSIYTHHCGITTWVDKIESDNHGEGKKGAPLKKPALKVAHAVGDPGVCRSDTPKLNPATYKSFSVFRLKFTEDKKWAAAASEVARVWSIDNSKVNAPKYTDFKDTSAPAFHSSSFGPNAEKQMAKYAAARTKEGGPDGEKFFCSKFVIACYQAAMGTMAKKYMALDAMYTSPMKLHHYLVENPNWMHVGDQNTA